MQFTGKKSKAIRPTKAMFKHLNRFYLSDWHHKHTYKSPKKRKPPFLRPVNLLRHSPRLHSQVHVRSPAAPPVRVSHQQAVPGHGCGNERGGRERESVLRINRHKERAYGRSKEKKRNPRGSARGRAKRKRARPARVRPLWSGVPPFAPPRFWPHLPSGSFPKRGVPHSGNSSLAASPRASTNRGRAAPPRLRHTLRRKQAGKIRAPLGTPVVSFREARW